MDRSQSWILQKRRSYSRRNIMPKYIVKIRFEQRHPYADYWEYQTDYLQYEYSIYSKRYYPSIQLNAYATKFRNKMQARIAFARWKRIQDELYADIHKNITSKVLKI